MLAQLTSRIATPPLTETCITDCGRTCTPGHLMCEECWRRVPLRDQIHVYWTSRAWRRDLHNRGKFVAYRRALTDARQAVR